MHCLYHAYERHLLYLGLKTSGADWWFYNGMRTAFNVKGATPGQIIPFMIRRMAQLRRLEVVIEHSVFEKEHHIICAENKVQRLIASNSDFGIYQSTIKLAPAIYTLIDASHAVFNETIPSGIPTLALQIQGGKGGSGNRRTV